jgi:enoyl-CoA hydratase
MRSEAPQASVNCKVQIGDNGVASVTIDRPPVNAMNRALYRELRDVMQSFDHRPEVNVVVLRSASARAFLAGADIKERLEAATSSAQGSGLAVDGFDPQRLIRECFWAVYDCAIPVIASVNRAALGAGLAVVACCDVVVASDQAVFGLTEIDVGLLGGSAFLSRLVGNPRMRKAFYTAERIPAQELLALGAIAAVVTDDELDQATAKLAGEIARRSGIALRLAKESFNRIEGNSLKEAYRTEQDYTTRLGTYSDSRDAMDAFLQHRRATFERASG